MFSVSGRNKTTHGKSNDKQPKIVLLDELLAALDPIVIQDIKNIF